MGEWWTKDAFGNVVSNISSGSGGQTTDDRAVLTFNQVAQVPEPSSAALLGLGGLALILRRRK